MLPEIERYTLDDAEHLFHETLLYGNGKMNIARLMTVSELESALQEHGCTMPNCKRNDLLFKLQEYDNYDLTVAYTHKELEEVFQAPIVYDESGSMFVFKLLTVPSLKQILWSEGLPTVGPKNILFQKLWSYQNAERTLQIEEHEAERVQENHPAPSPAPRSRSRTQSTSQSPPIVQPVPAQPQPRLVPTRPTRRYSKPVSAPKPNALLSDLESCLGENILELEDQLLAYKTAKVVQLRTLLQKFGLTLNWNQANFV